MTARIAATVLVSLVALNFAPASAEPLPLAMAILGRGPVVVFESGLGKGRDDWREVAKGLAPCLTVVLYDRPGIGSSPAPPNLAVPVLAAAVADDLLARLGDRGLPGPYLLVGHSLGGLYVQAFAHNHPGAVAAWRLSMRRARSSLRASSSRPCRRRPAVSRPQRRQALRLRSLRS